jgi:hypothetical protein
MSNQGPHVSKVGAAVILPLALLAALGVARLWTAGHEGAGIDFYQFWAVGQAVREGLVEDVYDPASRPRLARIFLERAQAGPSQRRLAAATFRKDQIQAASTPFLYSCFYLIQSGDYDSDILKYRILSLGSFLLSMLLLCRLLGFGARESLLAVAFAAWAFAPLQDDLRDGNVNQVQLALLSLYLLLAKAGEAVWIRLLGGALLGLAIAFKPNLALVAVLLAFWWVARKRYDLLVLRGAGIALGIGIAVLASSLFFGTISGWGSWLETLRRLDIEFDVSVSWGNFAAARLFRDWIGVNLSAPLYLAALGLTGTAAWRCRAGVRGREGEPGSMEGQEPEFLFVALGTMIPILAGNLAWPHYLVLALPICLYLLRPGGAGMMVAVLASAGILGICSTPLLQDLGATRDHVFAAALAAGSGLLFGLGCVQAWRLDRGPREERG